jgi:hypothetical protein
MYLVPVYFQQGGPGTTPTAGASVQRGGIYQAPDFHHAQQQNPAARRRLVPVGAAPALFLASYPQRFYGWQARQMNLPDTTVQIARFRLYTLQVGPAAIRFPKLGQWQPRTMDAPRLSDAQYALLRKLATLPTTTAVVVVTQAGTGGPPPKKRRKYVFDVYPSGRVVLRGASQRAAEAPTPKSALRVVVEGQPSEAAARRVAKAAGRAKRDMDAHRNVEEHIIVAVLLEIGELDV